MKADPALYLTTQPSSFNCTAAKPSFVATRILAPVYLQAELPLGFFRIHLDEELFPPFLFSLLTTPTLLPPIQYIWILHRKYVTISK